mmetsp:Transcript_31935/g.69854  ORF Transcript_31935/g.69854 Transcript_31935/m.69854 type:complete len:225 (-) Transcript_31935:9-683(-)
MATPAESLAKSWRQIRSKFSAGRSKPNSPLAYLATSSRSRKPSPSQSYLAKRRELLCKDFSCINFLPRRCLCAVAFCNASVALNAAAWSCSWTSETLAHTSSRMLVASSRTLRCSARYSEQPVQAPMAVLPAFSTATTTFNKARGSSSAGAAAAALSSPSRSSDSLLPPSRGAKAETTTAEASVASTAFCSSSFRSSDAAFSRSSINFLCSACNSLTCSRTCFW